MPKRFVSWIAVSSLPQVKKVSLDDQAATNRAHIAKWDGQLVQELSVPGKSRYIVTWEEACERIDAYAQLKQIIETRATDVIIYRDPSRLGRATSLIITIAELCYRAGILLYSTESPPTELAKPTRNLVQRMIDVFQSLMAQEEVDKFTRRNEMGMKARVLRGDFPGMIPYGWTERFEIVNGHPERVVELDESAAATIRLVVDLYLRKGYGTRPIAKYLNENGYARPHGGAWRVEVITSLLDRIWRYAGFVEINAKGASDREYIKAPMKWPAIISEADARAVEEERAYRASGQRRVESAHRFSGVVWCALCNKRMSSSAFTVKSKRDPSVSWRRERMMCKDFNTLYRHKKALIDTSLIHRAVRAAFEFMQDQANHALVLSKAPDRIAEIQQKIVEVNQKVAEQEKALGRADDAYIDNKMSLDRYNAQVDRIKTRWEALQKERAKWEEQLYQERFNSQKEERLQEIGRNGLAMLETDDIPMANTWLRNHIVVWVNNDDPDNRIKIDYL